MRRGLLQRVCDAGGIEVGSLSAAELRVVTGDFVRTVPPLVCIDGDVVYVTEAGRSALACGE